VGALFPYLAIYNNCYTYTRYYDGMVRSGLYPPGAAGYNQFCLDAVAILTDPAGLTLSDVFDLYQCQPSLPCCPPWGFTPSLGVSELPVAGWVGGGGLIPSRQFCCWSYPVRAIRSFSV
jgi:hypothetical protein